METRQVSKSHQSPTGKARAATAQIARERTRDSQQELGRYLADNREAMQMSLDQIARTTKIPKTSLSHLEAGRFDALPGDVFVRGFLRSYARCIHLDGDDVVRRYAQCGLMPAPVSGELADSFLAGKRRSFASGTQQFSKSSAGSKPTAPSDDAEVVVSGEVAAEPKSEAVRNVLRDAFDLSKQHIAKRVADSQAKAAKNRAEEKSRDEARKAAAHLEQTAPVVEERSRTFVPPSYNFDEEMSRRGPLTLGVIVLVIVATLTMSYLLRRPGTSTDGFTMLRGPAIEASETAGTTTHLPAAPHRFSDLSS